ncbi:hypothetical protein ANN_03681, partial [Periplaneta americana]
AVAYLAPFTDRYRRSLLKEWSSVLKEKEVPHTTGCSPVTTLGEAVLIRQWQLDGLPRDFLSTENAVLVMHSKRWPLFIDPQGQANRWIRNMGKDAGITIAKLSDRDLTRQLESCIRFGKPLLIENVGAELDPALDPVLLRLVYRQGGQDVIKLGDSIVPYSEDFSLYMTTKLPNPHYTPEVSIKVLLVNFTLVPRMLMIMMRNEDDDDGEDDDDDDDDDDDVMMTGYGLKDGLQDQLLALVVMEERADLEEARSALIVSSAQMKQELKECEDRILHRLSASEGSPVDDIDLIVTLEASKEKSEEIKVKVEAAEQTQVDIDATRALYIPVANRGQILFFCVSDLSHIDPMYQYSLEWFIKIFRASMTNTEKTKDISAIYILQLRAVASWSKASCLGLTLRNTRWFDSSWENKFSHEISASVCNRCPPSIVMHLGSYNRWRNLLRKPASYNGWGDHRANHTVPPFWLDDRPPLLRHVNVRLAASCLFERNKLHFAFLLCARIHMDEGKINQQEWLFLLAGGSPLRNVPNPDPSWISVRAWKEILALENLPEFVPFVADIIKNPQAFKKIANSLEPHRDEIGLFVMSPGFLPSFSPVRLFGRELLPPPWDEKFTDFQSMLMLKCVRPDKVTNAMQDYLTRHLGQRFVEPQTTDLQAMYDESAANVPLVFVLSTGTDPAADLYKFADKVSIIL